MSVGAVGNSTTMTSAATTAAKTSEKAAENTKTSEAAKKETSGVVYEKNNTNTTGRTTNTSNASLVAKLKADAENRTSQLKSLVEKMMTQQGSTIGKADDMWKFLASGDYTVSADVKAQAQADIAEDGYWGVNQTSDRILDFAKALAGDDPDKADEMLSAFKKGFEQATKSWGNKLPDISQRTYDAVLEKFEAWKNGTDN